MIRKDIKMIWLPGNNYAIDGIAKDINGKQETFYGNKLDAALFLIKALFQLLSTNRCPMVNIIVIGHELCEEGGDE